MVWLHWIAEKHALLAHLPLAAILLLPIPLLLAQRRGRGIRPWWTTSRYLAWMAFLALAAAALSGFLWIRSTGQLPAGLWIVPAGGPSLLRIHQILALSSLGAGVLCLRSLFRKRQDHQGIGFLALLAGLLWAGLTTTAGCYGNAMSGHLARVAPRPRPVPVTAPPPVAAPAPVRDPEASLPARALDFLSLEPVSPEFVKSPPHGNRWIRAWITPSAAQAYREGAQVPPGTLIVLQTLDDHWGRPGTDAGPLYAMEFKADGRPELTFYWGHVPREHLTETAGASRVYARGSDAALGACLACHGSGMAPLRDRSHWVVPRRKPVEAPPQ
jgi:hypothetical protein